jgi:lysozyme
MGVSVATANRRPNLNGTRRLSSAGLLSLQRNEGFRRTYYNDTANNCTYGVGTLAHMGLCTNDELGHPVSDRLIQIALARGVRQAEQVVQRAVTDHELTQDQFDAAVSFAYNVPGGAHRALSPANTGDMAGVARNMNRYIYEHPHDAQGRVSGPPRLNAGLLNRRRAESAPFRVAP